LPGSCIICAPLHAVADQMQSAAPFNDSGKPDMDVRPECIGASPSTSKLMQGPHDKCHPQKSDTTKHFMHVWNGMNDRGPRYGCV
jgi:hypothetical protein